MTDTWNLIDNKPLKMGIPNVGLSESSFSSFLFLNFNAGNKNKTEKVEREVIVVSKSCTSNYNIRKVKRQSKWLEKIFTS